MSGGGGGDKGDWRPAGGPGGDGSDPCNVTETTVLNSPSKAVIATLKPGDLLSVTFVGGPPQQLLAQVNGVTAGSLTSPSMLQIINCINLGRAYEAEVILVLGAMCQVRVQPK